MKKLLTLILLSCLLLTLSACSNGGSQSKEADLQKYDGPWQCGESVIYFESSFEKYTFVNDEKRSGSGTYKSVEGAAMLDFDGFYYNIEDIDENTIKLIQNGFGTDEESLDGLTFHKVSDANLYYYDLTDLEGEWTNENGDVITIDASTKECTYTTETSVGGCTINDDNDGKGWYLFLEGRAYIIMTSEGSFRLSPDGGLSGTFTR